MHTRVRELRNAQGLSLMRLAAKAGVSIPVVQRLERGENVGLDYIRAVAIALGVSIGELFEEVSA